MEFFDIDTDRKPEPQRSPKTLGKPALEEDVVCCLFGRTADRTDDLRSREDVFSQERAPRLNPGFGEQPSKKLGFGGGVVLPHERVRRRRDSSPGAQPIESRGVENTVFFAASGRSPQVFSFRDRTSQQQAARAVIFRSPTIVR